MTATLSDQGSWRRALVILLASLAMGRGAPAGPDFATYLAQHHYVMVPTESDGQANCQVVEARINGKKARLIIDSGAGRSLLTAGCARRLRLQMIETDRPVFGLGGATTAHERVALVSSFAVEKWEINHLNKIWVMSGDFEFSDAEGLFGFDSLCLNCAIIPVGGKGLLIKPGTMPPVSIAPYMQSRGFTALPMLMSQGRFLIRGSLNGQPLLGEIDSGAAFSCFELSYLKKVLGRDPHGVDLHMTGVDGKRNDSYEFTPRELMLGGYKVRPIMVTSVDSPMLGKEKVDALIGYDILATHDAVIDTGSGVLYMR